MLHDLRFDMSVYDMLGGEGVTRNGLRARALGPSRGASTARASCARVGGNRCPPQSSSAGSGRPHSTVGRWKSGSSRHSSGGSNGGGVADGCLVEPMSTLILARARVGHYRNCRNSSPAPRTSCACDLVSSTFSAVSEHPDRPARTRQGERPDGRTTLPYRTVVSGSPQNGSPLGRESK